MSYELLRLIWWALLGILLIGFAVMDGFDLGSAILLPSFARHAIERLGVISTIGPVWEGNPVRVILGGGARVAATCPAPASAAELHLRGANGTDTGVAALAGKDAALSGRPPLDLIGSKCTDKGVIALRKARPGLAINDFK